VERARKNSRVDDLATAVGTGTAAIVGLMLWAVLIAFVVVWLR
jgi:hypothetical protein